jgi:hypothetical protein
VFGAFVLVPWLGDHDRRGHRRSPKGLPQGAGATGALQRHPVRLLLAGHGHEHVQVSVHFYKKNLLKNTKI